MMQHRDHERVHDGDRRRRRRAVLLAVVSGGAVIALGATATLASWSDQEWVYAGDGLGGPGVATKVFEVQQNVSAPYANTAGNWVDRESNPGSSLTFGPGALALTPGDSVYAPVAIRSTASSIAGRLVLAGAVPASGTTITDDGTLWNAITVRVAASQSTTTCDAAAFSVPANIVASGGLTSASVASANALAVSAASGNVWHFCFELTLPTAAMVGDGSNLQGKTIAPAWRFSSTSV